MSFRLNSRKGSSFFGDHLKRAREAVSRWGEMSRLDAQQTGGIARDLNLSVSDFHAFAMMPSDSPDSLGERLEHIGWSERALAASQADVLRDLQRVCGLCSVKARCVDDLRRERRASPAKYCPNEQTLRALGSSAGTPRLAQILTLHSSRD
jgi:hypothetical protein